MIMVPLIRIRSRSTYVGRGVKFADSKKKVLVIESFYLRRTWIEITCSFRTRSGVYVVLLT